MMQLFMMQSLLWSLADGSDCDGIDVSLLQTQLRLDTSRLLEPIGRSFFSEDPQQSAEFWIRYTRAERMSLEEMKVAGLQESSENAAVLVKKPDGTPLEQLYFLKVPNWKSSKNVTMRDFVEAADLSWKKVMRHEQAFSPWSDFHDGHTMDTLRFNRLKKDQVSFQLYGSGSVGRAYIPHTTSTMEWFGEEWDVSKDAYASNVSFDYTEVDKCRNYSADDHTLPNRAFWKSTFAVLNVTAARDFAVDVLHAKPRKVNPYPWPPKPGCIAVQWLKLPHQNDSLAFQFHFVQDFVYDTVLYGIPEFLQYQREFLKSTKGCINGFMLNNLILRTASLDPIVKRLNALAARYFVFEIAAGKYAQYALLFSFPGNEGITLQIQSSHLSYVAPKPLRICS